MTDHNPLERHTARADHGAGFTATKEGGFAIVTPMTATARSWLGANASSDATWVGDGLVVEMRYFPDLADAIIAAGFLFESAPRLN